MKRYTTVLLDMDNTIFDFDKDERQSLIKTFEENFIPISKKTLTRYSQINDSLWKKFEKGEITKEDIKNTRFQIFIDEFGFKPNKTAREINDCYANHLAHSGNLIDGATELCLKLKKAGYKLYFVTNGIETTQKFRIEKTGFDKILDGVFISESIGFQKPMKEFFDYVFEHIEEKDKSKMILIGDSLTSDIKGALDCTLDCVWFNKKRNENSLALIPTYEFTSFEQIGELLL